jgi:hypothetical protein
MQKMHITLAKKLKNRWSFCKGWYFMYHIGNEEKR